MRHQASVVGRGQYGKRAKPTNPQDSRDDRLYTPSAAAEAKAAAMDNAVDVWRLTTASRLQRDVENVYFL